MRRKLGPHSDIVVMGIRVSQFLGGAAIQKMSVYGDLYWAVLFSNSTPPKSVAFFFAETV